MLCFWFAIIVIILFVIYLFWNNCGYNQVGGAPAPVAVAYAQPGAYYPQQGRKKSKKCDSSSSSSSAVYKLATH